MIKMLKKAAVFLHFYACAPPRCLPHLYGDESVNFFQDPEKKNHQQEVHKDF